MFECWNRVSRYLLPIERRPPNSSTLNCNFNTVVLDSCIERKYAPRLVVDKRYTFHGWTHYTYVQTQRREMKIRLQPWQTGMSGKSSYIFSAFVGIWLLLYTFACSDISLYLIWHIFTYYKCACVYLPFLVQCTYVLM